jgi:hypothetical protein
MSLMLANSPTARQAEGYLGTRTRYLALLWHFGSMLGNPTVAVRTTIRNRRRSEQLGDDGAADFRQ